MFIVIELTEKKKTQTCFLKFFSNRNIFKNILSQEMPKDLLTDSLVNAINCTFL